MFKEKVFYNQQYVIKQFENPTHVYLILDGEFQIIRRETRNQSKQSLQGKQATQKFVQNRRCSIDADDSNDYGGK